jgi:hypothetical protein
MSGRFHQKGLKPRSYRGPGSTYKAKPVVELSTVTESKNDSEQIEHVKVIDKIDENMGFPRYEGGAGVKTGWLINIQQVSDKPLGFA